MGTPPKGEWVPPPKGNGYLLQRGMGTSSKGGMGNPSKGGMGIPPKGEWVIRTHINYLYSSRSSLAVSTIACRAALVSGQ